MPAQKNTGRSKDRIVKSMSLPEALVARIQQEADEKYNGDFTRCILERMANDFPEAADFLAKNTTYKHSKKK